MPRRTWGAQEGALGCPGGPWPFHAGGYVEEGVELVLEGDTSRSMAETLRNTTFGKVKGAPTESGGFVVVHYNSKVAGEAFHVEAQHRGFGLGAPTHWGAPMRRWSTPLRPGTPGCPPLA